MRLRAHVRVHVCEGMCERVYAGEKQAESGHTYSLTSMEDYVLL